MWSLAIGRRGETGLQGATAVTLHVEHDGGAVRFVSEPVPIAADPDWADYRRFWQERQGAPLDRVTYRGEGRLVSEPGVPNEIDIAVRITPPMSEVAIDSGNLHLAARDRGQSWHGRLWLNGEQADRTAALTR